MLVGVLVSRVFHRSQARSSKELAKSADGWVSSAVGKWCERGSVILVYMYAHTVQHCTLFLLLRRVSERAITKQMDYLFLF